MTSMIGKIIRTNSDYNYAFDKDNNYGEQQVEYPEGSLFLIVAIKKKYNICDYYILKPLNDGFRYIGNDKKNTDKELVWCGGMSTDCLPNFSVVDE